MPRSPLPPTLLVLVALAGPAAAAQESAPTPAPPAARSPAAAAFEQALARLEAGDPPGAIALLEPFRGQADAPGPLLTLLGGLYLEAGRPAEALAVLQPLADADDADAAPLYHAGRAALAIGQVERGETYLERSAAKAPTSPAARDLGLRRAQQRRCLAGYKLLRPWAQAHAEDHEARQVAAFCGLELDRVTEVEALLSDLPQEEPRVRLLWGALLLRKGDPRGALAMLKPLAENRPPEFDRDWRRGMADAHFQLGESAAAIAVLEGHVGEDLTLALLLARAQHRNGQPAAAVATLAPFVRAAIPEKPKEPRPMLSQARLEYGRGLIAAATWPEAIAALEAATRLDPENAEAWQLLGQALQATGRSAEAEKAAAKFQEIVRSRPAPGARDAAERQAVTDPTLAQLQRGLELVAKGDERQGLALIAREVELAGDDIRPRLTQVTALLRLKRFDDALAGAEATLRAFPDHPDAVYQRGVVQMARQQFAAAEKDFRRALEIHPDHNAALNDLAVLLIAQKRGKEARKLLEHALAVKPEDPVAKKNLEGLTKPPNGL